MWAGQLNKPVPASGAPLDKYPSEEVLAPSTGAPFQQRALPLPHSKSAPHFAGVRCLPCAWGAAVDRVGARTLQYYVPL